VAGLGLLLAGVLGLLISGEWMARLLTPPPYPGSVRFNVERTEAARFVVEVVEYSTPDAPAQVAAEMGRLYGGFALLGTTYERTAVGYNLLNALALAGAGNPMRPNSTVWVYPDATTGATTIRVQLAWPR
jgi:hypothetical protein